MTRIRTRMKRLSRTTPAGATLAAVAIALFSAAALVAYAARQAGPDRTGDRIARVSRSAANAAEARAIWAPPRPSVTAGPDTITGCLEKTVDGFRLTDTEGASVPKSRNWKSMFFKKSAASIDIVDVKAAVVPKLTPLVGERVRVNGVLDARDLHLRTLLPLNEACD